MLIVIFILGIILSFVGMKLYDASIDIEDIGMILTGTGCVSMVISVLAFFILILAFPFGVDKKIAMYEEENTKIEIKVKDTVKGYMDYEQGTYENLIKDADLATLIIKYPELNSNELVKAEIDTYIENSKQIKELKEKSIDKSILAWWLYFGK